MSGERNGIAFIGGVLSLMAMVGCARQEPTYVPNELIGVWVTEAPGWEDRFLKLEKRTIHFGMGGNQASENPVVAVERQLHQGRVLFRIKFLSPQGLEYTKQLFYDPGRDELRYANRPNVVWKKAEGDVRADGSHSPVTSIAIDQQPRIRRFKSPSRGTAGRAQDLLCQVG